MSRSVPRFIANNTWRSESDPRWCQNGTVRNLYCQIGMEPPSVLRGRSLLLRCSPEARNSLAASILESNMIRECSRLALPRPRPSSSQVCSGIHLDVQTPEMDGFEATAEIRKREQGRDFRMPVIALTAHAMKDDRERCITAGMDGYLSKPIRAQELEEILEKYVTRRAEVTNPGEPAVRISRCNSSSASVFR